MILTNDGYTFPLDIKNGLAYLKMQPFTDDEYKELPHVHLTSDNDWDPSCLDHKISSDQNWYDDQDENGEIPDKTNFDITGNYKKYEDAELQFEVDKHILQ